MGHSGMTVAYSPKRVAHQVGSDYSSEMGPFNEEV